MGTTSFLRTGLAVAVAFLLATASVRAQDAAEDEVLRRILAELKAMQERLDSIERRLGALEEDDRSSENPASPGRSREPRPAAYADLNLLPDPTKEQARKHIQAIKERLRTRTSWSSGDPEPRVLAEVGSRHVDALLEAVDNGGHSAFASYAVDAVRMLAGNEHRDLIIAKLPMCRDLVKVVLAKGWEREARQILIDELTTGDPWLPPEWVVAVVRLKDPATYSALLAFFRISTTPYTTYQEIAGLPGMSTDPLDSAVADMWRAFQGRDEVDEFNFDGAARVAAGHGHVDALARVLTLLDRSGNSSWGVHSDLRGLVLSLLPFQGTNRELQKWFEENRSRLEFDRVKKKYLVRGADKEEGH